jgi:crotonobetainyl-CoA:carnitine CoA-transferase CaiB-like acyl-CoA transferase
MPAFATDAERVLHRAELAALIEAILSARPRDYWLERLESGGVPCGPINDYAQVFEDAQVRAREMGVEVDHPTLGRLRALGTPLKMSETPIDARRRAPLLGEHTREVLLEVGYSGSEIEALLGDGAIA